MALTVKQDNFCNYMALGKEQRESYMLAYDCNSERAASVESTKLLKRDDITARIAELRKPIINLEQNQIINARQKQIDFIQSRIDHCLSIGDEQSIIRYTDMLNKINALYKETEPEQKQESTVNTLDISTLKRLSGVS